MSDETEFTRKGDYEILGVLGAGGMGKVYKVRNVLSDRVEAMKVLLPNLAGQKELADRFLREIKVLASLNHPNIAALRTALTIDNQLVMIMEYVEGTTLASHLEEKAISWEDALLYADQVLAALSYAHKQNVIHRDIKPANMMLTPSGAIKLMDFGIARSGAELGLTVTGTTLGSLAYMSPEQVKCEPIDARSDLYSVGVSLYEMVTGQKPFKGDSNFSIMQAQLQQAPRPPIELSAGLPQPLNQIILMALSKEPVQRFQSADAFRDALKSAAASLGTKGATVPLAAASSLPAGLPIPQAPTVQMPPPRTGAGGHRGLFMALGATIVLVVLVAAGFSVPRWLKTRASGGGASPSNGSAPAQPATNTNGAQPVTAVSPAAPAADNAGTGNSPASPASILLGTPDAGAVTASPTKPSGTRVAPSQASREPKTEVQAPKEPPRPDPAQLAEVDHEIDQMSSRATAVNASLDNLQREQNARGMHLRGDIVATQERMQAYLGKAQAAFQAQDIEGAKKYLDLAETELGKIEKFLGH
jgi:eukaryotic-like serine/threonine-protein kinase